jgi:hypothetical protein
MAGEAVGGAAGVVPPPPSKVCKVFEGDTLGLDFGIAAMFSGRLSGMEAVFWGEMLSR